MPDLVTLYFIFLSLRLISLRLGSGNQPAVERRSLTGIDLVRIHQNFRAWHKLIKLRIYLLVRQNLKKKL